MTSPNISVSLPLLLRFSYLKIKSIVVYFLGGLTYCIGTNTCTSCNVCFSIFPFSFFHSYLSICGLLWLSQIYFFVFVSFKLLCSNFMNTDFSCTEWLRSKKQREKQISLSNFGSIIIWLPLHIDSCLSLCTLPALTEEQHKLTDMQISCMRITTKENLDLLVSLLCSRMTSQLKLKPSWGTGSVLLLVASYLPYRNKFWCQSTRSTHQVSGQLSGYVSICTQVFLVYPVLLALVGPCGWLLGWFI